MLSLKNVLQNDVIKEGLQINLLKSKELVEDSVEKVISLNTNDCMINITMNDTEMEFSNTLHYSEDKCEYLLESRLFETNGGMINAYLPVFDKDMNFNQQEIDDVWEYTKWINVKDNNEVKNIFKKL